MAFRLVASSLLDTRSTAITVSPITGFVSSSLDPLPPTIRNGMIAMGLFGLLSTGSTLTLICFITYRMVYWRRFYDTPIASNQIFVLIYNLLLADFQQALSFLFSFHWIAQNKLVGPSPACFAQGWLIQIGDVSSGLFVLAIAVHTFINLVVRKQVPMRVFVGGIIGIWLFCLILTAVGPITHKHNFFVPAGAWCWINESKEKDRLYLHYVWIFVSQLGSLVIYTTIFFFLRMRLAASPIPGGPSSSAQETVSQTQQAGVVTTTTTTITTQRYPGDGFAVSRRRILRTAKYMVIYPLAYVALTLPLAAGRVSAMAGKNPPLAYYCVAGTLMASCGVVDAILYVSTRKALVQTSVGVKGVGTRAENPLSRFQTNDSRRDQKIGDVRMDDLLVDDERGRKVGGGKGAIIVSKSVTRSEETEDSFEADNGGDVTPGRSESVRSLVGARKGDEKSWLA